MDSDEVLIKKYGNRRLYDTRRSGYITLEDLAQIVQGGATVRVVDANSGKDLTRQVLTQVILDQQERLDMIPVELLHTIIRTQGTLQQGPFSVFLAAVARQATSAGTAWAQQMAQMFGGFAKPAGAPPDAAPAEQPAPGEQPPGQPPAPSREEKKEPEPDEKLEQLRSRLDALVKERDTKKNR